MGGRVEKVGKDGLREEVIDVEREKREEEEACK